VTVEPAGSTVETVRGAGGEMVSMQPCHLDDPADCRALIELALGTYGRVDVLFNLAAMSYFNWLQDITDEEWDRARWGEVDLVFYLTRAAWPHLKASRGVVVNMASLNASLSFKILPSLAHTSNKAAESRRGESHPPALAEPGVNLSAHRAPIVQPSGRTPQRQ